MKAIRKSDGKVIEVDSTPYFNMKTDEEYRRCLVDGKHYKLSDLDFNVEEPEEKTIPEYDLSVSVAKLRDILEKTAKDYNAPQYFIDEIINRVKESI